MNSDTKSDANIQMHANATNNDGSKKNWIIIIGVIGLIVITSVLLLYIFDTYPFEKKATERNTTSSNNTQTTNTVSITPVPTVPEYAKQDVREMVSEIIIPELIPDNMSFKNYDVEGAYGLKLYEASWVVEDKDGFIVVVNYDDKNQVVDQKIIVNTPLIEGSIDPVLSENIVKQYFQIDILSAFECVDLDSSSRFCEAFWINQDSSKNGLGIISPVKDVYKTKIVYCEYHKGSPTYEWKSCNPNYKDTGVQ
jgi:hypothetical protein